jgi:hypothetical protein
MTFGDAANVESLTHHHGAQLVTNSKYAAFVALDPFFDIVMQGSPARSMATTTSK